MAGDRENEDPADVLAKCKQNLKKLVDESVTLPVPKSRITPGSVRQNSIRRLMDILGEYAGLRDSVQVAYRLENLFADTTDAKLSSFCLAAGSPNFESERRTLIEELTNHETYFYRHPEQLQSLSDHFLVPLLKKRVATKNRRVTIWSAACATGEEPYTMAMMVLDALKKLGEVSFIVGGAAHFSVPWKISIVGTDISERALKMARAGHYVSRPVVSFREMPASAWKFFTKVKVEEDVFGMPVEHFEVNASVKKLVQFENFNLMESQPQVMGADIVLCRNVLIYMREQDKQRIHTMLKSSLVSGGVIALGGADVMRTGRGYTAKWIDNNQFYVRDGLG